MDDRRRMLPVEVERLPQQERWDWTVWRPGDSRANARHGEADSVQAATEAAEATARDWKKFVPPED
jgi:hypothetical protein